MTTRITGLRISGNIMLSRDTEPSLTWISPSETLLGLWSEGDTVSVLFVANGINLTQPITYAVENGTLPDGITLDPNSGIMSGTMEDSLGQPTFTIVATSGTATAQHDYQMIIGDHPPPVWVSPGEGSIVDYANVNDPVSNGVVLLAQDPFGLPISYFLIGGELPTGVFLNPDTGIISGTYPDLDDDMEYDFTVAASNGDSFSARDFIIYVAAIPPANSAVWITPPGSIGSGYELSFFTSTVLAVDPHQLPITYVLVAGNIPMGLTLGGDNGIMSGDLPESIDDTQYTFILGARTSLHTVKRLFLIEVNHDVAPVLTDANGNAITGLVSLGEVIENNPFSARVYGTHNSALPATYTANGLGNAITIDIDTGLITSNAVPAIVGNPVGGQKIDFTVNLSDGLKTISAAYEILDVKDTAPIWSLTGNSLGADIGNATFDTNNDFPNSNGVNIPLASDAYNRPIVYSLDPTTPLPDSLTFDPNTGRISGTLPPTEGSDFEIPLTITATAGPLPPISTTNGIRPATMTYFITVYQSESPEWITNAGIIGTMIENTTATFQVMAHDPHGLQPVTYTIADGDTPPPGLSFDLSNGIISGTADLIPDADFDSYDFTFIASYNGLQPVSRDFSITVLKNYPPVWDTPAGEIVSVPAGQNFSVTILGHDPNGGPVFYEMIANNFPMATDSRYGTIKLNPNTGVISGSFPDNFIANASYSATIALSTGRNTDVDETFVLVSLMNLAPEWITPADTVIIDTIEQTFANANIVANDPEGNAVTYTLGGSSSAIINETGFIVSLFANGYVYGKLPPVTEDTQFPFTALAWDNTNNASDDLIYSTPREFIIQVRFDAPPAWVTSPNIAQIEQTYVLIPILATANGNQSSMNYSLSNGALPPGLTFDAANAQIYGTTPTQSSDFTYTFTITADNGRKQTPQNFNFTVYHNLPPVWITASDWPAQLGDLPLDAVFTAHDPNAPYGANLAYTVPDIGNVPNTISFTANTTGLYASGHLPLQLANAVYTFTAAVSDNIASPVTQSFTFYAIGDEGPVWGGSGHIANVFEGANMSVTLSAPSPEGAAITYALANSTTLPADLSLNGAVISGTAGAVDADTLFNFTISATDPLGLVSYQDFDLTIRHNYPPVWVTPAGNLGAVLSGYAVSNGLVAISPEAYGITYSLTGGTLPPGMSLQSDGTIKGALSLSLQADQEFDFTVAASDGGITNAVSESFSIFAVVNQPPTFSPNSGTILATQFEQTNVVANVSAFDPEEQTLTKQLISSPDLPNTTVFIQTANGMSGIGGEEILTKLPAITEDTTFNVFYVANDGVQEATAQYYIDAKFNSPPVFTDNPVLPNGVEAQFYPSPYNANAVQQLVAVSNGSTIFYSVSAGTLPTGLTLTSNGALSGTCPIVVSDTLFTFTVTATTGIKATTRTYSLTVKETLPPVWDTGTSLSPNLMEGANNVTYSLHAHDTNGLIVNYTLDAGSFPDNSWVFNAVADPANGICTITGDGPITSNVTTLYNVTIGASNGFIRTDRTFTLTLKQNLPAVWSTPAGLLNTAITGSTLSKKVSATDPEGNAIIYLENAVSNAWPAWITLSNSTGNVSGVYPAAVSNTTYFFDIDAYDGFSNSTRSFSVLDLYSPAPIWTTNAGLITNQIAGSILSNTVVATDVYSRTVHYAANSSVITFPSWMTLNTATGHLSGNFPNVAVTTEYDFYIDANNGVNVSTQEFTIIDTFVATQITSPSGAVSNFDGSSPIIMTQAGAWTIQFSSYETQTANFQAWGAGGGTTGGGAGGYASGSMTINPGTTMTVWVGGGGQTNLQIASTKPGGFGGGGVGGKAINATYYCGSGGGLSGVFISPASFGSSLLIAGGGGGGGSESGEGGGGGGGGTVGGNGGDFTNHSVQAAGGGGGTQSAGGTSGTENGVGQAAGSALQGANTGTNSAGCSGGGGGYYGGGAGTGQWIGGGGTGGGGGSGYIGGMSNTTLLAGSNGVTTVNGQGGSGGVPPRITDGNYVSGVGYPSSNNNDGTAASNGMVIITITS